MLLPKLVWELMAVRGPAASGKYAHNFSAPGTSHLVDLHVQTSEFPHTVAAFNTCTFVESRRQFFFAAVFAFLRQKHSNRRCSSLIRMLHLSGRQQQTDGSTVKAASARSKLLLGGRSLIILWRGDVQRKAARKTNDIGMIEVWNTE